MLDHLRQKILQVLSAEQSVLLSSYGPADIQTSRLPCALYTEALDDVSTVPVLYLLVPRASEHLLNLEHRPAVVALGEGWELHGSTRILAQEEIPAGLKLLNLPQAAWGRVVAVQPARLHLRSGVPETIDLTE